MTLRSCISSLIAEAHHSHLLNLKFIHRHEAHGCSHRGSQQLPSRRTTEACCLSIYLRACGSASSGSWPVDEGQSLEFSQDPPSCSDCATCFHAMNKLQNQNRTAPAERMDVNEMTFKTILGLRV